jgi:hypothetical protein
MTTGVWTAGFVGKRADACKHDVVRDRNPLRYIRRTSGVLEQNLGIGGGDGTDGRPCNGKGDAWHRPCGRSHFAGLKALVDYIHRFGEGQIDRCLGAGKNILIGDDVAGVRSRVVARRDDDCNIRRNLVVAGQVSSSSGGWPAGAAAQGRTGQTCVIWVWAAKPAQGASGS